MTLLPDPQRMIAWNQNEKLIAFQHMADLFATRRADPAPGNAYPLPRGAQIQDLTYQFGGRRYDLADYLERQRVAGLLVLKDGKILLESYLRGTDENTHWTSWSVGKSVVSTLVGIAVSAGAIKGVDEPITDYIPELAGSAYSSVRLRDMLQMCSGVAWSEDPTTREPNVRTFAAFLARQEVGKILDMAKQLPRSRDVITGHEHAPGTRFNYSNVEAFLVGILLERATGERISSYLERQIWKPFGMEQPVWWMAEGPGGADSGAGDFSATLRDYGRLAQFILNDGVLRNGERKLAAGWLTEASAWSAQTSDPNYPAALPGRYGYFWWNRPVEATFKAHPMSTPDSDATMVAWGLFGQHMFVNRKARLAMVQWSVQDMASSDESMSEAATVFNSLAIEPSGKAC